VAAIVVASGIGFVLLQTPARQAEARASAAIFHLVGDDRVRIAGPTSIEVLPPRHQPFRAVVTPSCSSIGSLIALACLGALAPPSRKRNAAVVAAMGTVAAGNVVRIAASLAIGLASGRQSLILFHDWVGSIFGFGYTLGGYLLLLHLLLPRPRVRTVVV
jgi:carbamoyl-phosphate synthase large subunit